MSTVTDGLNLEAMGSRQLTTVDQHKTEQPLREPALPSQTSSQ